jgi:hypothetical protein
MLTTSSQSNWLFVLPGLLLLVLLGLPLLALFLRAAGRDFFGYALSDTALAALRLSLVTSLISVAVSLLIGTPLAYILSRWDFPGRLAVELLVDLPVVLPPSVAGLALFLASPAPLITVFPLALHARTATMGRSSGMSERSMLTARGRWGPEIMNPFLDPCAFTPMFFKISKKIKSLPAALVGY